MLTLLVSLAIGLALFALVFLATAFFLLPLLLMLMLWFWYKRRYFYREDVMYESVDHHVVEIHSITTTVRPDDQDQDETWRLSDKREGKSE